MLPNFFPYLPRGAPATLFSSPGAMNFGQFPSPKNVVPFPGSNKEAQTFLSHGAEVIIRMRGLPYNATPKEIVSVFFKSIKTYGYIFTFVIFYI